jgi:HEAT repeat protein
MKTCVIRLCFVCLAAVLIAPLAGCGPPRTAYPAAINSQRPEERIAAIKRAAETHDRSVIGLLVDRLDDEDEGVRFFAILALERLTGTRLGYNYHASEAERGRAIQRWRGHLAERESPPAIQASGGSGS